MKKLLLVFVLAFLLNFVWEYFHSSLYVFYQHGPITIPILLRAALFDAVIIVLLYFIFLASGKIWASVAIAALFAIALELFALQTGRWEYNSFMPILPLLKVGLTPILQLPLLTYATLRLVK